MCWKLLRFCWIVAALDWWKFDAVLAETTEFPFLTLNATANGKFYPDNLKTYESSDDDWSDLYGKFKFRTSEIDDEGHRQDFYGYQTTMESPSLFSDLDRAASSRAANLVSLADGGAKDVVENGLGKEGSAESWGDEARPQLLDIDYVVSSVQPDITVVTEINVVETIDGRTITRKPTSEELNPGRSPMTENDILAQEDKENSRNFSTPTDVEDLDSFLKTDSGYADDGSDPFLEWNGDDEPNDMESILKDDADDFPAEKEEDLDGIDDKRMLDEQNASQKEPQDGDYRKIYHTERKNFTNVKEVKIVINESEGDLFDDDDDPKSFSNAKSNSSVTTTPPPETGNEIVETTTSVPITTQRTTTQEGDTLTSNNTSPIDFDQITRMIEKKFKSDGKGSTRIVETTELKKTIENEKIMQDDDITTLKDLSKKLAKVTITISNSTNGSDGKVNTTEIASEELVTIPQDTSTIRIYTEFSTFRTLLPDTQTDDYNTRETSTGEAISTTQVTETYLVPTTTTEAIALTTTTNAPSTTTSTTAPSTTSTVATSTTTSTAAPSTTTSTSSVTPSATSTTIPAVESTEHEMTPDEVESILNSRLEESEKEYEEESAPSSVDLNITIPVLRARILNNTAEFSVQISNKNSSSYVPSTAYINQFGNIVNITWKAGENQNDSVVMRVEEHENFFLIKEITLSKVSDKNFIVEQKPVAFNPDPTLDDTMPGRTRVVVMRDGTHVTFSNVDFLKKSSKLGRGNSEATTRDEKLWHFEVASICIATVVVTAVVLYVVAIKTKAKISLSEKNDLPQVTHC